MNALPERFLTLPIAHRALHDVSDGRPENSLRAIRAAIEANYCIEIDIQGSADRRPMVFHDYDLRRLTAATGSIHQRRSAELAQIPLRGGDETIPTLMQVLKAVAGRVPILIDIKDQDGGMGANVGPLESAVATELQDYRGEIAVMSFNPHSIAALAKLLPDVPRGLVTGSFDRKNWPLLPDATRDMLREIPDFKTVAASFISHRAADLSRPRVVDIRASGTPVLCWTITDAATEATARLLADNITFEGYLPDHIAA